MKAEVKNIFISSISVFALILSVYIKHNSHGMIGSIKQKEDRINKYKKESVLIESYLSSKQDIITIKDYIKSTKNFTYLNKNQVLELDR